METTAEKDAARSAASHQLANFVLHETQTGYPSLTLLTARLLAKHFVQDVTKLLPDYNFPPPGSLDDYNLLDHMERLRFVDLSNLSEGASLVGKVFESFRPGTDPIFSSLAPKVAYAAFGICYSGGRDDKVCGSTPRI
jgi:import receptor subunit TOM20